MYSQIHTFAECRSCILKMLERYSSNGIENTCGEVKDIENRMVDSINVHVRKLYAQFFRKTEKKTVILEKNSEVSACCYGVLPENFAKIRAVYDKDGFPMPLESFEISACDGTVTASAGNAGNYVFEYYVSPQKLPKDCPDDAQIILPPILFDALCYMCASDLCPSSDGELFSKLTYKYREILENYYDGARSLNSGRNSFYRLCGSIGRKKSVCKADITNKTEG